MINVLVNAYAVSPNWGSEPGMGWNWVVNLANYCNVYVITEGEWSNEIEDSLKNLPQRNNIKFYYIPLSCKIRRMCWNQGDWRFYWYYRKWQKLAYAKAKEIISSTQIDAIHQLNMIGFREPGYLWKIKNIPYVWGPVGGMGDIPIAYLKGAGWKQNIFCRIKNLISNVQIKYSIRVKAAVNRGIMIAATREVQDKVRKIYCKDIPLINETGCYPKNVDTKKNPNHTDKLNILWVGKFDFRKQFNIALEAVRRLPKDINWKLDVISPFSSEIQKEKIVTQITKMGIGDQVFLHGRMPNKKVHEMMRASDLFLFTSIMEGTPHVVLEALQNSLPVICIDTCGQGDVVNDKIGIKVPLSDFSKTSEDISLAIENLYRKRDILFKMKNNSFYRQNELSWDSKIKQVLNFYQ